MGSAVFHGLEVEVASGRAASRTNVPDHGTNINDVSYLNSIAFHVVVGGDDPITMINLDTVSTAVGVPSGENHLSTVSGIDAGPTRGSVVLTKMLLQRLAGNGACPDTEGGRLIQN